MQRRITYLLKWVWVAVVLISVVFVIRRRYEEFAEAFRQIDIPYFVFAFAFILIGKFILPLFMRYVLLSIGKELDFWTCFKIYNITQLGKYIPGNVWHFVSKAAAYRNCKFGVGDIRDALVVENLWLVLSAFVYGLVLVFVFEHDLALRFVFSNRHVVMVIVGAGAFALIVAQELLHIDLKRIFSHHTLNVRIVCVQIFVWTFLGLGFAVLALPFLPREASVFLVMGLYAIAFSIGFVTPFAPSGLGVREGVLAIGLSPYMPLEVVIIVSVANRLLYLLVEIILASMAHALPNSRQEEQP